MYSLPAGPRYVGLEVNVEVKGHTGTNVVGHSSGGIQGGALDGRHCSMLIYRKKGTGRQQDNFLAEDAAYAVVVYDVCDEKVLVDMDWASPLLCKIWLFGLRHLHTNGSTAPALRQREMPLLKFLVNLLRHFYKMEQLCIFRRPWFLTHDVLRMSSNIGQADRDY